MAKTVNTYPMVISRVGYLRRVKVSSSLPIKSEMRPLVEGRIKSIDSCGRILAGKYEWDRISKLLCRVLLS